MPALDDSPLGRHAATPRRAARALAAERAGHPFLVYRGPEQGQQIFGLHPARRA
jgi:hypothetical protein